MSAGAGVIRFQVGSNQLGGAPIASIALSSTESLAPFDREHITKNQIILKQKFYSLIILFEGYSCASYFLQLRSFARRSLRTRPFSLLTHRRAPTMLPPTTTR